MSLIEHRGLVELSGDSFGATLSEVDGRLRLEVFDTDGRHSLGGLEQVPLAHLRSSSSYFTLLDLKRISSQARLGVGGATRFRVGLALEEALFPDVGAIQSDHWIAYFENVASIAHVTGLEHSLTFHGDELVTLNWALRPVKPVTLDCAGSGLVIELGQDVQTTGDLVAGPTIAFRYPAALHFAAPVGLEEALAAIHRMRRILSLMMGRVLAVEDVYVGLTVDARPHRVRVHGLRPVRTADTPDSPIVPVDLAELGHLIDRWMHNYERLSEALDLHFQALEQRDLDLSLRFQLFVQAVEALHRRTLGPTGAPIVIDPILETLRANGVKDDVIDRVGGVLAHAHEPGLRQRLKHYVDSFKAELAVLRPDLKSKSFVGAVAATRNFYAHRTDRTSQVLEGADLWDATELVKALSHFAILKAIDAPLTGVAERMVENRFVQFSIRT
jgi:hypothetical protein